MLSGPGTAVKEKEIITAGSDKLRAACQKHLQVEVTGHQHSNQHRQHPTMPWQQQHWQTCATGDERHRVLLLCELMCLCCACGVPVVCVGPVGVGVSRPSGGCTARH